MNMNTRMHTHLRHKVITRAHGYDRCADPATPAAGVCCSTTAGTQGLCKHALERVSYAVSAARCAAVEVGVGVVCPNSDKQYRIKENDPLGCGYDGAEQQARYWTSAPCRVRAQVDSKGWVRLVHEPHSSTTSEHGFATRGEAVLTLDNLHRFRVAWDEKYPITATNCSHSTASAIATTCVVHDDTCVCDAVVVLTVALDAPPTTAAEVKAACQIGHLCPADYPPGTFTLHSSGTEVEVYRLAASSDVLGSLNADAVYRIKGTGACYANRRSTVYVGGAQGGGGGGFSFRNAPHFVSHETPTAADAAAETEALLDHLFQHPNVAPFIGHRMIQRLTSSNPSPRYVRVVADAFRTGTYGGRTYSGAYGDLGAMVAAVLSDREARATTLDADPAHGVLREPLLLVHHVLRALEFTSTDGREIELLSIEQDIGMAAHRSPSVFNFYQPDFSPGGALADAGLYAPEADLATAPFLIGLLNGLVSLVDLGLTSCSKGFGPYRTPLDGWARMCFLGKDPLSIDWSEGRLEFTPQGENASAVVSELDLLLTAGRLNPNATAVITQAFQSSYRRDGAAAALQVAQKLFFVTAEFRATNLHALTGGARQPASTQSPMPLVQPHRFKAVVMLYMDGGCDSFNLLIPSGNCATKDMFSEYTQVLTLTYTLNPNPLTFSLTLQTRSDPTCSVFWIRRCAATWQSATRV